MSFGIVRVQKMTGGSIKGIEIHDRREKEGISHTNKDINWERTDFNYDLHELQNKNYNKAVKERILELNLTKAVRKDAVMMAQVLVTSDREFFDDLEYKTNMASCDYEIDKTDYIKKFFEDSYNFLAERYGKENIISATVHLDERTPHMHFNFVPVTADGRLSAKSILTRNSLIEQQTAFFKSVGKVYGLKRGEQGGKKKHLEIAELKEQTAIKNANTIVQNASKTVQTALEQAKDIQDSIKPLQAEYEACRAYVRECDKESQISTEIPDYAEIKEKGLFKKQEFVTVPKEKWIEKHISANEKEYLEKATKKFENEIKEFRQTTSAENLRNLNQKIKTLEKLNSDLNQKIKTISRKYLDLTDENTKLKEKNTNLIGAFSESLNNTLKKMSKETSAEFQKEYIKNSNENKMKREREKKRDYDFER